jgi:hypothetical protein
LGEGFVKEAAVDLNFESVEYLKIVNLYLRFLRKLFDDLGKGPLLNSRVLFDSPELLCLYEENSYPFTDVCLSESPFALGELLSKQTRLGVHSEIAFFVVDVSEQFFEEEHSGEIDDVANHSSVGDSDPPFLQLQRDLRLVFVFPAKVANRLSEV